MTTPIPHSSVSAAPAVSAAEAPGRGPGSAGDLRPDLLGMSRERLGRELGGLGGLGNLLDRPFRVEQIYDALHRRGATDFAAMTDVPQALRAALAERFRIGLPEIASRHVSADGTAKYLFKLPDGATIESVDIPDRDRRTLCLSSQAGCALACTFCVTGYWGAGRNLTAGEIVGQVAAVRADRGLPAPGVPGAPGLNLVFMGMGEPLLNLASVAEAIDILGEEVSRRRITVSTAGVVPGIEELARWPRRPNLAVSLHAPDDERRSRVMPLNRQYPLAALFAALDRYPLEKGRKITYEYILIRGFNDAPRDADALVRLLAHRRAKVNLIPLNPDPVLGEAMAPPARQAIDAFAERLQRRGVTATVRRPRGDDVAAACGQLRAFGSDPRGPRSRRPAARRGVPIPD